MRNFYNVLVGKPEGKRRRFQDNINMDVREIEWEVVDWIHPVPDRDQWRALVNTVMDLPIP